MRVPFGLAGGLVERKLEEMAPVGAPYAAWALPPKRRGLI